ncbi:MAG: hypothetical protein ACLSUR_06825 [Coprobacillus cateniformis]|nr:MAG TPA: FixH [Caudoviricetes sp.]
MLKALLIIFVIAKILGLITWPWWIVLCPLIIAMLSPIIVYLFCYILSKK